MEIINEYFKKNTDKVTFIELKDDAKLSIDGYSIEDDIPLPMITEELIDEIKEGNLEEEIKLTNIIDAIIYLMGIDKDFPYIENYKEIINTYDKNMEEYIFYKGIRFMDKEDYDNGAICFRTLKIINPENVNGLFNYSLALENIGKRYLSIEKEKQGIEFIKQATLELESILDIDDKYPLAYYKLGYHYRYFEQNLKAKLIWNKYLLLDKDELRLEEIRRELESIENSALVEAGMTYLSINQFDNALSSLLKLLPELKDWWQLNYLIAASYKGLNEYEKAIGYFEKALKENNMEAEVYNELGICHFYLGDIKKAIDVFTEGIKNIKDDYKLFFNRALGYLQLDNLEKGYKDVSIAVKLNPNDENMNIQKERLEEVFKKIKEGNYEN